MAGMTTTIQARVREGIRLLDARGPEDWRARLDAERLDIFDPGNCVLGQLFDGYTEGMKALDIPHSRAPIYGFTCHVGVCDCRELTEAWQAALRPRPSEPEPPPLDDTRLA